MRFYFGRLYRKLIAFLRRGTLDSELAEELATHRFLLEQDLRERGTSRHEAARKIMGNITLAKEESRDMWTFQFLEDLCRDAHYALRGLLRAPAFTITAMMSLAIGIGANTAIFTAVFVILFKPLAVENPAALVTFATTGRHGELQQSYPLTFARQLQSSGAFSDVLGAVSDGLSFQYGNSDRAKRIMGEVVTPNFFSGLGIKTILGQGFTDDVRSGKWAPEAVLSYSFWKTQFAGDPKIIGRVVRLNTYPFTVVGVSSSSFYDLHQGQDPELRLPVLPPGRRLSELNILNHDQDDFDLMARLGRGVSRAEAKAAASSSLANFVRASPNVEIRHAKYRQLRLLPGDRGWPDLEDEFRTPLAILFLLVFTVLLIACANVANMSLARAGARHREIAVRTALGASRNRLIQQFVTESLILAGGAGITGFLLAGYVSHLLLYFLPQGHIHFVLHLRLNGAALVFTIALSLFAALLFGLTAARQSTRGDLIAGMKSDSNGSVGARERFALKKVLVVGQMAFSLALLVVAGLFISTVFNLYPRNDFADPSRILSFTIKPQQEIYSPDRIRSEIAELIRGIQTLPGVEAVSLAENGPFASRQCSDLLQVPGNSPVRASCDSVLPGFFKTVRLPILSGRDFMPADKPTSPNVMIVNRSLAAALFPGQNALGRTVEMSSEQRLQAFQIVGIVGDSHYYNPRRIMPMAFFTFQDDPPYMPTFEVRVQSSHAERYMRAIRYVFDAVDRGFPIFDVRTLQDRITDSLNRERMIADLSTAFGTLALALAAVGLYGVFTYSVTQRTREIGLRMALGCNIRAILWLIVREALLLVGTGTVLGSMFGLSAAYVVSRELYGVTAGDPFVFLGCTGLMAAIALLAVSIPAWRASRIDPMIALRQD